MAIKLGGGGGSASQINEIVYLNNGVSTVTLNDGRVYLKGGVYETTVSNYPDALSGFVDTGTADGWTMDSGGVGFWRPEGLTHDGTVFWATGYKGNNRDSVRSFNTAGVQQSVFLINGQFSDDKARGIAWDGSYLWVVDYSGYVFKYSTGGTYQNVTWSANSQTGDGVCTSIEWDGSHFWVLDQNRKLHKYNSSGVYQNVFFQLESGHYWPEGVTWDGTNFWIVCNSVQKVVEYTPSGVFTGRSFQTATAIPSDIASVGSDFWTVDDSKAVNRYVPSIGISSNNTAVAGVGQNYLRIK